MHPPGGHTAKVPAFPAEAAPVDHEGAPDDQVRRWRRGSRERRAVDHREGAAEGARRARMSARGFASVGGTQVECRSTRRAQASVAVAGARTATVCSRPRGAPMDYRDEREALRARVAALEGERDEARRSAEANRTCGCRLAEPPNSCVTAMEPVLEPATFASLLLKRPISLLKSGPARRAPWVWLPKGPVAPMAATSPTGGPARWARCGRRRRPARCLRSEKTARSSNAMSCARPAGSRSRRWHTTEGL